MLRHPDTAAVFKLNLIAREDTSRFPVVPAAPGTARRACARRCGVGLAPFAGGRGRGRRTWVPRCHGAMASVTAGTGHGTRGKDARNVPRASSPSAGAAGTERYVRIGFSVPALAQPGCVWLSAPVSCARATTQKPGGCPCRWSTGWHISAAGGFARRRPQG